MFFNPGHSKPAQEVISSHESKTMFTLYYIALRFVASQIVYRIGLLFTLEMNIDSTDIDRRVAPEALRSSK